jgi:hypothetical protein
MQAFLCPVSEILSYALMRNHFHIVLRIKSDEEIGWLIPKHAGSEDPFIKWSTTFALPAQANRRKPEIQFMLRHMFGAYSKWFNVRYRRSGKLFEERFERKVIHSEAYLRQLIVYVNRNPEHHGIIAYREYQWISYFGLIEPGPSWLAKEFIIDLFGNLQTFVAAMDKTDCDVRLKDLGYDGIPEDKHL